MAVAAVAALVVVADTDTAAAGELERFASCEALAAWGEGAAATMEDSAGGSTGTDGGDEDAGMAAEAPNSVATGAPPRAMRRPSGRRRAGDTATGGLARRMTRRPRTAPTSPSRASTSSTSSTGSTRSTSWWPAASRLSIVDLVEDRRGRRQRARGLAPSQATYDAERGIAWVAAPTTSPAGSTVTRVAVTPTSLAVDATWSTDGWLVDARRVEDRLYVVAADGYGDDVVPVRLAARAVRRGAPPVGRVRPDGHAPRRPAGHRRARARARRRGGGLRRARARDHRRRLPGHPAVRGHRADQLPPVRPRRPPPHRLRPGRRQHAEPVLDVGVRGPPPGRRHRPGRPLRPRRSRGDVAIDIAPERPAPDGRPLNEVVVLDTDGDLDVVGRTPRFGHPGETIQGVRFVGEVAYAVTFLQTDPFYVLDLADPAGAEGGGRGRAARLQQLPPPRGRRPGGRLRPRRGGPHRREALRRVGPEPAEGGRHLSPSATRARSPGTTTRSSIWATGGSPSPPRRTGSCTPPAAPPSARPSSAPRRPASTAR